MAYEGQARGLKLPPWDLQGCGDPAALCATAKLLLQGLYRKGAYSHICPLLTHLLRKGQITEESYHAFKDLVKRRFDCGSNSIGALEDA